MSTTTCAKDWNQMKRDFHRVATEDRLSEVIASLAHTHTKPLPGPLVRGAHGIRMERKGSVAGAMQRKEKAMPRPLVEWVQQTRVEIRRVKRNGNGGSAAAASEALTTYYGDDQPFGAVVHLPYENLSVVSSSPEGTKHYYVLGDMLSKNVAQLIRHLPAGARAYVAAHLQFPSTKAGGGSEPFSNAAIKCLLRSIIDGTTASRLALKVHVLGFVFVGTLFICAYVYHYHHCLIILYLGRIHACILPGLISSV